MHVLSKEVTVLQGLCEGWNSKSLQMSSVMCWEVHLFLQEKEYAYQHLFN